MDSLVPPTKITVKVGCLVELALIDQFDRSEKLELHVVQDSEADYEAGFLGAGTLLGRAILHQPEGKTLAYQVGDLRAVRILAIHAGIEKPQADAARRREEVIRKAVADSDRTNAVLFASSFSGKWGDYDPEGVENWETDSEENQE